MYQQNKKQKYPINIFNGNSETSYNSSTANSQIKAGRIMLWVYNAAGCFFATKALLILLCLTLGILTPLGFAQTLSVRSALASPDATIVIPVEITEEVQHIYGFQMDMTIEPSAGAPALTIGSIEKGGIVVISPKIDTNPYTPVSDTSLRIGLSTEIPYASLPRSYFSGPGVIMWVEATIPVDAVPGQSYRISLEKVILAGPNNRAIPLRIFNGTITVAGTTVYADTISAPATLIAAEGETVSLPVTVTGNDEPVPGTSLYFSIDESEQAFLSAETAVTGTDGVASIDITGNRGGETTIRINSPGLEEAIVILTVLGVSPGIISDPPGEVSPGMVEMMQGTTYVYDVEAIDPNGDILVYELQVSPTGMTIDPATGLITWIPETDQPQSGNDVTIVVRDPDGNTDTQSFHIFIMVDADADGFENRIDCDDANPDIYPGAPELCNGIDDDCNGIIDDGALITFYLDTDGDGYGNPAVSLQDCMPPLGYVDNNGDCDDSDPNINPGRKEIGDNGIDEDCNPNTPDNWSQSFITAISDNGSIYYAKSNGDGTFTNYRLIMDIGGYSSRGITIDDFNNDGYLDFIAGGGVSGRVDYFLFLNDGTDNFFNQGIVISQSVSGSWAMDMTSGDINQDGFADVIAGTDSSQVIVALGNGMGNFTWSVIDLGPQSRGMDIADFNNDGNLDIVRATYSDGNLTYYSGNGDGTFKSGTIVGDLGDNPYGVVAADFDNDGVVDIIANGGSNGDTYIYKGNNDGTFTPLGYTESLDTNRHGSFDGYDFNNDGNVDVVLSDYNGYSIYYYPGNGNGTFGDRVKINPLTTSGYVLSITAPPYRVAGTPYPIIRPLMQVIPINGTAYLDGSASHNNDDGYIVTWEWNFGDNTTGTGPDVSHIYTTEGQYIVRLRVTDNNGKFATAIARVFVQGEYPVADSGGPYSFGELYANNGIYTVTLDGTGSTDDSGIDRYVWDFGDFLYDTFDGDVLNTETWISSTGVTQDDSLTITGASSWGTRYLFSQADFIPEPGLTLYMRILSVNATGTQQGIFGFKNTSTNYSYTQLPYAVYFNQGGVYVYENGSNRGNFISYEREQEYEIKIVLTGTGANYYIKKPEDKFWQLFYISTFIVTDKLKAGAAINYGIFNMDDAQVSLAAEGPQPVRLLEAGTYPVTLIVTDTSGQIDSDTSTIHILPSNPPIANPGGPYTADDQDGISGVWYITFDGSGSSDDFGILSYAWDFNETDGMGTDATGISPIFSYNAPGTYTVTLTVTDHALQTHSASTQVIITSSGNPPVADPGGPYIVNEESAFGGVWTVEFEGCGSTDDFGISHYTWSFGDGDNATTYYCGENTQGFAVGTDLYGYDILSANLRIIGTENNTKIKIINLATGQVVNSQTINMYQNLWNVAPGDGIYFKVKSDKPIIAHETNNAAHTAFFPSLESGPVGRQFTIYYNTYVGFYVFAYEDAVVTFLNTAGTQVAQQLVLAGTYWNPGVSNNTIYRVTSTGRIAMQNEGLNGYTMVPSSNGEGVGTLFYAAVNGGTTSGVCTVFAYENAIVSAFDMDTDEFLFSQALGIGETFFQTGLGTRRIRIQSTGEIEVWVGDTDGGTAITNLGDDISFASGRGGQEFYLNTLQDGAVIFAPYNNTLVTVDGTARTLNQDEYWHLTDPGISQHITATRPVVIQTLGRANNFNDMGTFLGGRSAIRHYYTAVGTYELGLTVHDHAGLSDTKTTSVIIGASEPPVADHGGPYVIDESDANGGIWQVTLDASHSSDDYGIYKFEWDFDDADGIQVDSNDPVPLATYTEPGIYTVTLSVFDHANQMTRVTTTVTVLENSPPIANANGPYIFNEDDAHLGTWPAPVDGSLSSDDFEIYRYEWLLDPVTFNFDGTSIDNTTWYAHTGVIQNNNITLVGNNTWGSQYIFSTKEYAISEGVTFQARVLPENTSGYQYCMFGFKHPNGKNDYNNMAYAIYFYNGTYYIYEDGNSRGALGSFTRNVLYDIRIVLKAHGARYYVKEAASDTWTLIYDSDYSTSSPLNIGSTIRAGTFIMDEVSITEGAQGVNPLFKFRTPGVYTLSLTVKDNALQEDTDITTITINTGNPPVADIGGPYSAEVGNPVVFNGAGSTDDFAIATYEWTFGDTTGEPLYLPYQGNGATPRHIYQEEGTFEVTLLVTDHAGNTDIATTTVIVSRENPPAANAGGPYTCGAGGPPVYLNGSNSTDDFGIVEYRWDVDNRKDSDGDGNFTNDIDVVGQKPIYTYTTATGDYFNEDFSGTVVDTSKWISSGATQDDSLTLVGTGYWTNCYIFSTDNYGRDDSVIFSAQIIPVNTIGTQIFAWGLKNNSTNYTYSQMPHAFYFYNDQIRIYENGSLLATPGTYTRGIAYDLSIELKSTGSYYYIKESSQDEWTLLYETNSVVTSSLKPGINVNRGTIVLDNFSGSGPDNYIATLTVEDGAGQTSTSMSIVNVGTNLPPDVITVPWVGHDPSVPHEVYNGKAITLKGIVRDADPVSYQWDFGDGTSSDILSVTDPYNLSVIHTYPDVISNTPIIARLTVWDARGQSDSDIYSIIVKNKTLSVETNIAIDEGLWYLHTQQKRAMTDNYPSGSWYFSSYYSSPTASALQAFEINGHLENGDHKENPYVETVDRGFKYLFTKINAAAINLQTYGEPDTNGNGIGVEVSESNPIYQGGMVMDAIASSISPLTRTVTGGDNIRRRTYYDILTDMVDMFAWGQDDNASTGGWRYVWNTAPDNSAAQWGAIGMQAANDTFGIPVPDWVKVRNNVWLDYSYDGTGFGYTGQGNTRATTPSGMVQLAFDGKTTGDDRWKTAENYIASQWAPDNSNSIIYRWLASNENTRDYYAMYAFTKAMRLAKPEPVVNFSGTGFDWYHNPETGIARCIIDDQLPDGRFSGYYRVNNHMRTAWGIIMLSQTLFVQPPVADAGRSRVWGVNIPLTFDASGSYHIDPFKEIVKYEWDFNGDGVYDFESPNPICEYVYTDDPATLPRVFYVTLRVTDNNTPPLTDTDTIEITIAVPPHPPVAVPGGPYTGTAGLPVILDGSGSFDIDPTDYVYRYEWEMDNVFPYDFDERTGMNPSFIWEIPGTYNIGLRVFDNGVMNDLNNDGIIDEDERLSDQAFTTITIVENLAPIADAGGPYIVNEASPVTLNGSGSTDPNGDPIYFAWDLNNDGSYDDGNEMNLTHTYMENGTYTIGLEVTDTLLSDIDTTTVIVMDLSPQAEFSRTPVTPEEGSTVSFTDQSVSFPDTIVAWSWDFGGLGSSNEQNPVFVFTDNGTYPVTLTITDSDGSVDAITHDVAIADLAPQAEFSWTPVIQEEGSTVSFTDQSSSSPDTIVVWSWDFSGLGSSNEQNPVFVFTDNGTYPVTLTITDSDGSVDAITHDVTIINVAPIVNAGPDQSVSTGEMVYFNGSFTDPGTSDTHIITWDFGDNTTETGTLTPIHVFENAGTYTVHLTVTDDDGGVGIDELIVVTASGQDNNPPVADAGKDQIIEALSGTIVEVTLDGSLSYDPDGDELFYTWSGSFGTAYGMNPVVQLSIGIHTITLTVSDGKDQDSDIVIIKIKELEAKVGVIIKLIDSNGNGIQGGVSEYFLNEWQEAGVTDSNGETFVELSPGKYKFGMEYNGSINYKYQDVSENSIIVFATKKVEVKLMDSSGNGIAGGITYYYKNTWQLIGETDTDGSTIVELLPDNYYFSMTYLGVTSKKYQTITENTVVIFQTRKVIVKLIDSLGDGIEGGITRYFSDSWNSIGTTDANGNTQIELLPYKYKFSMEYKDVLNYKYQDIGADLIVIFNTVKAEVYLTDSSGNGIEGGITQYFYNTWQTIGTTDANGNTQIELLPYKYKFSIEYKDVLNYKYQDIGADPIVIFNTVKVEVNLTDTSGNGLEGGIAQYFFNTWQTIGTTDANGDIFVELLPYTYKFFMKYESRVDYKYQDINIDRIVAFIYIDI